MYSCNELNEKKNYKMKVDRVRIKLGLPNCIFLAFFRPVVRRTFKFIPLDDLFHLKV